MTYLRPSRPLPEPGRPSFSFEFYPPRSTQGDALLWRSIRRIEAAYDPSFVSVTYGAGGSSRERTVGLTERIAAETTLRPVAHLTAVGHSVTELRQVIGSYAEAGVHDLLALRGDPPDDPRGTWVPHPQGFRHAGELVSLIRESGNFTVGVAAFPERHRRSPDWESEIRHFVAKCRAGADYAITQMFFRADDYLRLRDRVAAAGCDIPIIPALMPATDVRQIQRFAALSNAVFPQGLADALARAGDDAEAAYAIGVEHATVLAERLLGEGAPGLHHITLNRSSAALDIQENLGIHRSTPTRPPALTLTG
ncbi:methylenetetrahydrofolate reductase [NAD(P)H] [Streptomyces sp. MB09-01]|uniref:methylenetetrahydrofolate reductase [NAD(P)H] n=1 Tax=Streptomyces sp. MB09-01 TaxID=3028666 RepID=UPI0029B11E40|nr:methylenetetrahydrofolate reductase [NAD(P)H] [Streptomyces sp. MB09-01]MDX3535896.1 methylenetetrahydrofolate reductase [NAD(P)H] [Streptomyces sp. MB09-01]